MELEKSPALVGGGSRWTAPVRLPEPKDAPVAAPALLQELKDISVDAPHNQGEEAIRDVMCGSIAGLIGKYIEYPFDTIKVRLQSQPNGLPLQYTGPSDCFRKALIHDGFRGVYRGISAPLVGAAVENSCLFFSYRLAGDLVRASGISPELKANPEKDMPLFGTVFCAMVAGAFTSFFLTPIELVKCKIQVPLDTSVAANARPGIPSIIGSIYRHQGIRGFWHGQLGTLIREVGGGVAWFGSYEFVKGQFKKFNTTSLGPTTDEDLTIAQRMISGAAAGAAYNLAFYPADTIKSRMQTENVQRSAGGISTFSSVGRSLWAQHGLKGMYRGCGITVARSVPSSAFIFTVYEELKSQLPKRDDDD